MLTSFEHNRCKYSKTFGPFDFMKNFKRQKLGAGGKKVILEQVYLICFTCREDSFFFYLDQYF